MKFEETFNNIETISLKEGMEYGSFVYFLLEGEEVVYVGQTHVGISRPLSHRSSKVFDTIKILPCNSDSLNEVEGKYILKYRPKYNKELSHLKFQSLKNIKLKLLKCHGIRIDIRKLRSLIKLNGYEISYYNGLEYISEQDSDKIIALVLSKEAL